MGGPIEYDQITVTFSNANVAQKITDDLITCPWYELFVPSTNSTSVFQGNINVTTTNQIPRTANSLTSFSASQRGDFEKGDYFDLSKIYLVSATAGDTVIISYPKKV